MELSNEYIKKYNMIKNTEIRNKVKTYGNKTKYKTTPRKLVIVTSPNTKRKLSEARPETLLTSNTSPRRMIAIFNK